MKRNVIIETVTGERVELVVKDKEPKKGILARTKNAITSTAIKLETFVIEHPLITLMGLSTLAKITNTMASACVKTKQIELEREKLRNEEEDENGIKVYRF